jgi:hypothetical protein
LTVTFRDERGTMFHEEKMPLRYMRHTAFDLAAPFPQSSGRCGSVQIQGGYVAVLGLRFHPAGAFTSSHGFER